METDPASYLDQHRYPVGAPRDDPARRRVVEGLRRDLATGGVAILDGFLTAEAVSASLAGVERVRHRAHLEDVWGTPYLGLPEDGYPEGHPRRTEVHSLTHVLAYDLVPDDSPVRALFGWDPFLDWIADIVDRGSLHRMDDPLGALNLTVMEEGHVQGWHYDSTDFVVSLALRSPEGGGRFECAAGIRSDDDEHYVEVAEVLAGRAGDRVDVYPMTPGTLMVFEGRRSLHRVSPVEGDRDRVVALFGYSTQPGTCSSELLRLVRYGRTEPLGAG